MYYKRLVKFWDEANVLTHQWDVLAESDWSNSQIISVARMQTKNYLQKATVDGFCEIPPESKELYDMSKAIWCDTGNHAFSARDTDRKTMKITEYDENGFGREVEADVCGECSGRLNVFGRKTNNAHIAALEAELGMEPTIDRPKTT